VDNVTHSLFALTLARTPIGRAGPGTTAALLIASNAPDSDIVKAVTDGGAAYLAAHRGPTHGPIGILSLGIATAAIVRLLVPQARLGRLTAASCLAVGLHVLMDWPTSYGTRLLSPFSSSWFALDLLPIIDLYLLGALAIGLVAAQLVPARAATIATIVLLAMGFNYTLRAAMHQIAIARGRTADAGLAACDGGLFARWPGVPERKSGGEPCIAALPSFTSPFTWRVIRRTQGRYEFADFDVFRGWISTPSGVPDDRDEWVERASHGPLTRILLGFSRFPAARVVRDDSGGATVYWNDLRFAGGLPGLTSRRPEIRSAFSAAVRLDASGRIIDESLSGGRFSRSAD
jgi:membrane-bound metal-dependent hydrolase YbcI (DUF457 family)